ncbi:hypothetical protein PTKIN_Ptkin03bG0138100 [Pterospermum kingtungense]
MFSLIGGEKIIGYWSRDQGISINLGSARAAYSTSRHKLKKVITSRNTRRALKANDMARNGKKLTIGILIKSGFPEFVNIDDDHLPGFSIEVFTAVSKKLGHDYHFVGFNGTRNDLCCQVKDQKMDAAVYIAIVASRTESVDFTLPYLQSGVVMLIKVRNDGPKYVDILKPVS